MYFTELVLPLFQVPTEPHTLLSRHYRQYSLSCKLHLCGYSVTTNCAKAHQIDVVSLADFCFCCLCFWYHIQKIIPMFSSITFMISGLTVKSLTHFKFIFVSSLRLGFNFTHSFACEYIVSRHHLLKRKSFPY